MQIEQQRIHSEELCEAADRVLMEYSDAVRMWSDPTAKLAGLKQSIRVEFSTGEVKCFEILVREISEKGWVE